MRDRDEGENEGCEDGLRVRPRQARSEEDAPADARGKARPLLAVSAARTVPVTPPGAQSGV